MEMLIPLVGAFALGAATHWAVSTARIKVSYWEGVTMGVHTAMHSLDYCPDREDGLADPDDCRAAEDMAAALLEAGQ